MEQRPTKIRDTAKNVGHYKCTITSCYLRLNILTETPGARRHFVTSLTENGLAFDTTARRTDAGVYIYRELKGHERKNVIVAITQGFANN